ncbi:hypothetical protein NDGK_01885 [Clostridiales bacterium CHKCI001]|nr:hypothetical protein NDGK_01885 [Clostridiales bacterium CHKCI001]
MIITMADDEYQAFESERILLKIITVNLLLYINKKSLIQHY